MATIPQAYQRLIELRRNMSLIGMAVLNETSEDYLNLNRDQMMHGENSKGEMIGLYRNMAYERMKTAMNPLANSTVDLKLTGDFQRELTLRIISKKRFALYSQDAKNNDLMKKYGEEIFGLNDKYLDEFRKNFFHVPFKQSINDFWNKV